MDIDQLRDRFPNENGCRKFFESIIWQKGRRCPHCGYDRSCKLRGASSRPGLYECYHCRRQFTVTTKTPMHSTKVPLWKWLQAMYYMVSSSKGVSSVILGRWLGVSQPTAWKMGHAIRSMMDPDADNAPLLKGIVELDEKYFGGKPRYEKGVQHRRGKGTTKQCILVAVERHGSVRAEPVEGDKVIDLMPPVFKLISKDAHLMTDEHKSYQSIGKWFTAHSSVNHSEKEYARGDVHNNTAESFNAILERAKQGVFHYLSRKHLKRYLHEIGFRWDHRIPEEKTTRKGTKKVVMRPMPVIYTLSSLLTKALGRQLLRTPNGSIVPRYHSLATVF